MNTTAEAVLARRMGNHRAVVGTGPAAQLTIVEALTGRIDGRGGWVQLVTAGPGSYDVDLPLPNTVSLTIVDLGGHNHVLRLALESGPRTIKFNGLEGNWIELVADPSRRNWQVRDATGVKLM